ncbi:DUF177 domain-containing protein [Phenylobacterium sp.]|uniref:YceD family protein n=1 Tax=Phenylobacterium sp. TaxID=1871053 RepID=UPI002730F68E|nr:YceD family protein [Phenylobacterium sp.]MDP1599793.1 YceD family protein [Phenylobacterium sp.]MDP3593261.1 YceD family protein [Phenylobacterium sp.]
MSDWKHVIRLADVGRAPVSVRLEPDAETREKLAKELKLEALPALSGKLSVRPWLDGAEILGRYSARVVQICGVTLDPFEEELEGEIAIQVVPPGSPQALIESEGSEISLDLDAPDPPDVLESDEIDLAHYLVEQLVLDLDPFPRKPGVEFDYKPAVTEESPFAVLKRLKDDGA